MINLYKSNDIYDLVEQLANDIKANSQGKLFDSPIHRIVIPSLVNKAWLNFALEEKLNVLFRVEYDNLNWCPYRLAKDIGIKHLDQTATKKDLFFEILSILKNRGEGSILEKMPLVKKYINDSCERVATEKNFPLAQKLNDPCERVATEKTFQLAQKLADVFLKYIDYNVEGNTDITDIDTDIISKWNKIIDANKDKDFDFSNMSMSKVEECEFLIYNELTKSKQKNDEENLTRLTILKEFDFKNAKHTDNIKLYIFNYPYISKGNMATLKKLSEFIDINIYYNPINEALPICQNEEYKKGYRKISLQNKYYNILKENISKENIIELDKENKEPKTVLDALKYGVKDKISQDKSLQVLACPGIYREVECVYNSIIQNLNTNSDLKPEDIGVILTDADTYYPAINGVFGMNSDKVPFNLICGMPNVVHQYIEGIKSLAYINESFFTKDSVKDLFENPCFKKKFNISQKEVEDFIEFADKENIWAFFDGNSKREHFDHNDLKDQYTWNYTATNLRLGSIMDLDEKKNEWEGFIPKNIIGDYKLFFNVLAKIYYEITFYKTLNYSISDTSKEKKEKSKKVIQYFQEFINSFLMPEKNNDSVKSLIDKSIKDYIEQTQLRNYLPTFMEVYQYIYMVSSSSNYSKGRAFTGGVVVGKLFNMRVCNFKILYVLGLNEGVFPRQDKKSSLDLTLNFPNRITGEEEDKYALYKLITSTEEKVYLSYSAKDLEKDAKLYPSGALDELIGYISENIIDREFQTVKMPLFGRSLYYYCPDKSKLEDKLDEVSLSKDVEDFSDVYVNYSENDLKLAKIDWEQEYNKEYKKVPYSEPDFTPSKDIESVLKVNVKDIVKFLMNPVEYALKSFDMKDKFENEKDYIYEPVSIKNFECNKIINECAFEYLKNGSYSNIINKYKDNGLIPQNEIGKRIGNILNNNIDKFKEKLIMAGKVFTLGYLIGDSYNIFEQYNKKEAPIKIDNTYLENIISEYNSSLEETEKEKEIDIKNESLFPYGIRDVELSCLIPIVYDDDIYLYKCGEKEIKYEYEAKIMLLVYILKTEKLNAKAFYINNNAKPIKYEYKITHNDTDCEEDIKKENLSKIRRILGKLLIDMQNIDCVYDYLPYMKVSDDLTNADYVTKATKFGEYSSHKHYIIEKLPNIFNINKENPIEIIKNRMESIDDLFSIKE